MLLGKPDFEINTTKNTEQLRRQFVNDFIKQSRTSKTCKCCKQLCDGVKFQKQRVILSFKDGKETLMKFVNPSESRGYLREIWKRESEILMVIAPLLDDFKNREYPTDIFYSEVLIVPPPMTRPVSIFPNILLGNYFKNLLIPSSGSLGKSRLTKNAKFQFPLKSTHQNWIFSLNLVAIVFPTRLCR